MKCLLKYFRLKMAFKSAANDDAQLFILLVAVVTVIIVLTFDMIAIRLWNGHIPELSTSDMTSLSDQLAEGQKSIDEMKHPVTGGFKTDEYRKREARNSMYLFVFVCLCLYISCEVSIRIFAMQCLGRKHYNWVAWASLLPTLVTSYGFLSHSVIMSLHSVKRFFIMYHGLSFAFKLVVIAVAIGVKTKYIKASLPCLKDGPFVVQSDGGGKQNNVPTG